MKNVLIVDDNQTDRQLLKYNFDWYGYNCIEAENGHIALELALTTEKLDLILSDAPMPVMDGFQLLQAIKQDQKLRHLPFIFYSSYYIEPDDRQFAIKMGARAYINKPLGREEFWLEISKSILGTPPAFNNTNEQVMDNETFLNEYYRIIALKPEGE